MSLDTAVLDELIATVRTRVSKAVNITGLSITSNAAAMAPVDTSALRNSILSESKMEEDLKFVVQDGVEYGVFQELGTSRMSAQPFMIPAVEQGEGLFISEIGKAITP